MYEEFFGLSKRPFKSIPDPDLFVELDTAQEAIDELLHCVTQARGIGVVTAPAGLGKTILCKRLAALAKSQFQSIFIGTATFSTRLDLLQNILYEFGVEYDGLNEHQARLKIQDAAQAIAEHGQTLLIILDEAHLLNLRFFEELRVLADYAPAGESLIRLVLSGQFELEEKLADPSLAAVNQRIGCHVCLKLFTLDESSQFIANRLTMCGADDLSTILDEESLETICRASDGNPRCLCQLADHSLMLAFADERRPLDQSIVMEALDDLKELPLHWSDVGNESAEIPAADSPSQRSLDSTNNFVVPDLDLDEECFNEEAESIQGEEHHRENEQIETPPENVEFSVLEVGAGIQSEGSETISGSTQQPSFVSDSTEVGESVPPSDPQAVDQKVVDKYAQLEIYEERHGTDLDYVLDPEQFPHPVGFRCASESNEARREWENSSSDESRFQIEDELLSTVDQLGEEITDIVNESKRRRRATSNPLADTWIELDVVQPESSPSDYDHSLLDPLTSEANESTHGSGEMPPAELMNAEQMDAEQMDVPAQSNVSEQGDDPSRARRFSTLFTRLRERRQKLKENQA